MKTLTPFIAAILAVSALSGTPAHAAKEAGNGADSVILPDDTVILADPFLLRTESGERDPGDIGTRIDLSPVLVSELRLIFGLMARYGLSSSDLHDEIFGKTAEYYLVEENNKEICENHAIYQVPAGARVSARAACTVDGRTYLREDLFKKMALREQAKTIVHERLRALRTTRPPLNAIADITNGIETLLTLYYEQRRGQWRELTDDELGKILSMNRRFLQTGLGKKPTQPLRQGGGEIQDIQWSGGFIGVGSRVEGKNGTLKITGQAGLVNSDLKCVGECKLQDGSIIADSSLTCSDDCELQSGSSITRSSVTAGTLRLGSGARIVKSELSSPRLRLKNGVGRYFFLPNYWVSELGDIWLESDTLIERSRLASSAILMASRAQVVDSSVQIGVGKLAVGSDAKLWKSDVVSSLASNYPQVYDDGSLSTKFFSMQMNFTLGDAAHLSGLKGAGIIGTWRDYSYELYYPSSTKGHALVSAQDAEYSRLHRRPSDGATDGIAYGSTDISIRKGTQIEVAENFRICGKDQMLITRMKKDDSFIGSLSDLQALCKDSLPYWAGWKKRLQRE